MMTPKEALASASWRELGLLLVTARALARADKGTAREQTAEDGVSRIEDEIERKALEGQQAQRRRVMNRREVIRMLEDDQ